MTGKVEVWREGKAVSAMDVERGAVLTIVENADVGPRLGKWMPFSPYSVAPLAAVSARPGVLEPASEDGLW